MVVILFYYSYLFHSTGCMMVVFMRFSISFYLFFSNSFFMSIFVWSQSRCSEQSKKFFFSHSACNFFLYLLIGSPSVLLLKKQSLTSLFIVTLYFILFLLPSLFSLVIGFTETETLASLLLPVLA